MCGRVVNPLPAPTSPLLRNSVFGLIRSWPRILELVDQRLCESIWIVMLRPEIIEGKPMLINSSYQHESLPLSG